MDKLAELAKEEFDDVVKKYDLMKEMPEYTNVLAHIVNEEYQHGLEFENIAKENGIAIDSIKESKDKATKIMDECL